MKRDWDVIRDVLLAVEALDPKNFQRIEYSIPKDDDRKTAEHAVLLWKAGFIQGIDAQTMKGACVFATGLTWAGHDLLQTIQSKPVWEKVKATAQDKGIELTFEAVKKLGSMALDAVLAA